MGTRNTPAAKSTAAKRPQKAQGENKVFNPVPDGWYDLLVVDADPEYRSQTSTTTFRVLKMRMAGSLRFKDRTFSLFISESETGEKEGKKFDSQRAQLRERFGIDPWTNPEGFLDLRVRGHVTVQTNDDGKQNNRVTSIYPANNDNTAENE